VPPYNIKKPKNLCFEGFLRLVDVSFSSKNGLKLNFKRQNSPFSSHFCHFRKIAKNYPFSEQQPQKRNNKHSCGCQLKIV
jgi:hypothetical protein